MKIHRLKTWPDSYDAVVSNTKRFEVRVNDRGFQVGDVLLLERWDPDTSQYTGAWTWRVVTFLVQGVYGLPPELSVLSLTAEGERPPGWGQATLEAFLTDLDIVYEMKIYLHETTTTEQ